MTTYVWRNNRFVDKSTGEPMAMPKRDGVCAPMVRSDIEPHIGPNGKWITSRAEQRRVMAETGTCPWEPINDRPRGTSPEAIEAQREWAADQKVKLADIDKATKQRVRKAQKQVLQKHGITA